jgi:hypothetical protein
MKKLLLLLLFLVGFKTHYGQDYPYQSNKPRIIEFPVFENDSLYRIWVDAVVGDSIVKRATSLKKMDYPIYDSMGKARKGYQEIHAYRTPKEEYPINHFIILRTQSLDGKEVETKYYYFYFHHMVKILVTRTYDGFVLISESHYVKTGLVRPVRYTASDAARVHMRQLSRLLPALKLNLYQ